MTHQFGDDYQVKDQWTTREDLKGVFVHVAFEPPTWGRCSTTTQWSGFITAWEEHELV